MNSHYFKVQSCYDKSSFSGKSHFCDDTKYPWRVCRKKDIIWWWTLITSKSTAATIAAHFLQSAKTTSTHLECSWWTLSAPSVKTLQCSGLRGPPPSGCKDHHLTWHSSALLGLVLQNDSTFGLQALNIQPPTPNPPNPPAPIRHHCVDSLAFLFKYCGQVSLTFVLFSNTEV